MSHHIAIGESAVATYDNTFTLVGNVGPDSPQNSIIFGTSIPPKDNSVILAQGETEWLDPSNNINIAHVMQADSDTKDVMFPGNVHVIGSLTQEIDKCAACGTEFDEEPLYGIYDLCVHCLRETTLQFRAKESWAEKNGDPLKKCMDEIAALKKEIKELKKSKDPEYDWTNSTQYM